MCRGLVGPCRDVQGQLIGKMVLFQVPRSTTVPSAAPLPPHAAMLAMHDLPKVYGGRSVARVAPSASMLAGGSPCVVFIRHCD